jgi:hypothetical protein
MPSIMNLPPDFWIRPQPGGAVGLFVGAAAGCVLWFFFFFTKWKATRRWRRLLLVIVGKFMVAVGLILGIVVGQFIASAWDQRDSRSGVALGIMGLGLFIVLGAIAVRQRRSRQIRPLSNST